MGSVPNGWFRGLSVMLENVVGFTLVTKLRAILLTKAGFNYHNRLIFGSRMMNLVGNHNMVPGEIFSRAGGRCNPPTGTSV